MINVFIAGAQKAGTTSVLKYLGNSPSAIIHPQIEMTYFYVDDEFQKGESALSKKYKLSSVDGKFCIAKHATLTRSDNALKRLKEHNPDCKIIFCTRDPVKRAFSSYLMEKRGKSVSETFDEVIKIAMEKRTSHWYYNVIVELGCYQKHINRILKYFPKDQLMVVRLEDLVADCSNTIVKMNDWIGLPEAARSMDSKSYNSKSDVSISSIQRIGKKLPRLKQAFVGLVGYEQSVGIAKLVMKYFFKGQKMDEKLEDYPEAKAVLELFYTQNP